MLTVMVRLQLDGCVVNCDIEVFGDAPSCVFQYLHGVPVVEAGFVKDDVCGEGWHSTRHGGSVQVLHVLDMIHREEAPPYLVEFEALGRELHEHNRRGGMPTPVRSKNERIHASAPDRGALQGRRPALPEPVHRQRGLQRSQNRLRNRLTLYRTVPERFRNGAAELDAPAWHG